jgi:hypothetical protein
MWRRGEEMSPIDSLEIAGPDLTRGALHPIFYLDAVPPPSGTGTSVKGHIDWHQDLIWQHPLLASWNDSPLGGEREIVTGVNTFGRRSERIHESVNFYADMAAFLDLHQQLLPVVYELKPEESKRVTEILFKQKIVKRLD